MYTLTVILIINHRMFTVQFQTQIHPYADCMKLTLYISCSIIKINCVGRGDFVTLEQIRFFLSLAQTLSFTKTAEIMYTSQPTVSRQIKFLEEDIGFDLFYRKTNGITLTPSGKILYEKLKLVAELIDTGLETAKNVASCENTELKIGCLITLDIDVFLADCFRLFNEKYPCVQFVYEKHGFKSLRQKLTDHELDLIFTLDFKSSINSDLEVSHVFEAGGICVIGKNDPLAKKDDFCINDLSGRPVICLVDEESPRGLIGIKKICENHNLRYPSIIQVPNLDTVFFYVSAGYGFALLDKVVSRIHTPDFKFIDVPNEVANISVIALWNKNDFNPAIPSFIDIVQKESKKDKNRYL